MTSFSLLGILSMHKLYHLQQTGNSYKSSTFSTSPSSFLSTINWFFTFICSLYNWQEVLALIYFSISLSELYLNPSLKSFCPKLKYCVSHCHCHCVSHCHSIVSPINIKSSQFFLVDAHICCGCQFSFLAYNNVNTSKGCIRIVSISAMDVVIHRCYYSDNPLILSGHPSIQYGY